MTNEKILLQLEKGYDIKNPQLAQVLKNTEQSLSQEIKDLQENTIRTDTSQDFSNAQQDVTLSNIGLDFIHIDYSILGTTITDAQAQSIVNSRGIILTNVPESSVIPTVYLKGLNDNNYCYFLTINGNTIISQISFNKNTKGLSNSLNTDLHYDSVRYNATQTLTNTQKQQARTNIGVKSADELLEDADFIAYLKTKLGLDA